MHPAPTSDRLTTCLYTHYNLSVISLRALPGGYDANASVYEAVTAEGNSYCVKVRRAAINPASLLVPRLLIEQGTPHILAPLRTNTGELSCPCDGCHVVVFPFIQGATAMVAGLTDAQWREFGATLRAIHTGDFAAQLQGQVPAETFSLPSAALVRSISARLSQAHFTEVSATRLAAFWAEKALFLEELLLHVEALGRQLQTRPFPHVLCHADIHAANILVSSDGSLSLIDWDGPLLAPTERDLLFIIGSTIARDVEPHEEALFFEGYGPVEVDLTALAYYRYERAIEDIGSFGESVFFRTEQSEAEKEDETRLLMHLFAPGQILETAMEADRSQGGAPPTLP